MSHAHAFLAASLILLAVVGLAFFSIAYIALPRDKRPTDQS